jgi:hypothetical protein
MAAAAQSTYIINTRSRGSLSSKENEQVITLELQALSSADATNQEALDHLYPEFGTRFKRDFCGGQRLFVSGLKNQSKGELIRAHELDSVWADWYNANLEEINTAFTVALQ